MSKGQKVGYIRVSMETQSVDRQLIDMELDKKFIDKLSGKNTDRVQFQNMMNYVREHDIVYVHSMDRLARNLVDLRNTVGELNKKGVAVTFVKENLTFTGAHDPMSNLLLSMMGAFAEFERDIMLERQREGIRIAKLKGKYKGRKRAINKKMLEEINEFKQQGRTFAWIAKHFSINRVTIYNYLRRGELASNSI